MSETPPADDGHTDAVDSLASAAADASETSDAVARSHEDVAHSSHGHSHGASMGKLALGALGIVYGDIGTSPLYAFKEAFHGHHLEVNDRGVIGAASLAFWALIVVITIKYLMLVMKADNNGEGGILTLVALLPKKLSGHGGKLLIALGIFGTALLYGDGMITPAISVLAAVEGMESATTSLKSWVIPVSIVILTGLFLVQRRGTHKIGAVFGPIMAVWFAVLAALGIKNIADEPGILAALNPLKAFQFFGEYGMDGFLALGSIFLVVTGGEALYADMGHFGRKPIWRGWFSVVFPALALNYMGQGALLMKHPEVIEKSPFFAMGPRTLIWPMVILATMATIIASQALISGAFSLTTQAMRLDYLPRIQVRQTSAEHSGQVYVPIVNWILMVACIGLVLGFRSSTRLAAAYGIAVTMTMAITTLLFMAIARHKWNWSALKTYAIGLPLLIIDLSFLAAQVVKIPNGGWFALAVGLAQFMMMTTWRMGRTVVANEIKRGELPLAAFVEGLPDSNWTRVPGVAAYLFKEAGATPPALLVNLRHNHALHETVLLVSIDTADVPVVANEDRVRSSRVGPGIWQVVVTYGFMDNPDLPDALALLTTPAIDAASITYFLGRETVVASPDQKLNPLRERIFVFETRTAASAARFFNLPSNQVFEVGTTIEV
jgi:KUP system potassium uptake protein